MKLSEAIEDMVEVMQKHGHHKRAYKDPKTGSVCVYGAINTVLSGNAGRFCTLNGNDLWYETVTAAIRTAAGVDDLVTWNDAPETSSEDVLLAMKKAAEALREEGK